MSLLAPNITGGSSSPAGTATPPMMRATIASRSMALEIASRTRLSRNGFLPSVPATPGGRLVDIVEMQVDDAVGEAFHDLEAGWLDPREVLDRHVLDQVDVAGQQRRDARAGAGDRAEDDALPGRLVAPDSRRCAPG